MASVTDPAAEPLAPASGAVANPQLEFAAPLPEDAEDHVVLQASPVPRCPRPTGTMPVRVVWSYAVPIVLFHLLLPLAFVPYFFSWTGVLLVPIGNYVFCSLGIGAGFHRLLTHRSYKCTLWFEHLLAILGTCSMQQAPARWVLVHRMHHQHSDHQDDPHSPMVNWFWGHMGWVMFQNRSMQSMANYERYAKDLLQDPFYMKLERNGMWFVVGLIHALLFFLAGYGAGYWMSGTAAGALQFGLSILLWGVVVRVIYSWHVTWGVNSFGHMFGYRNYNTDENSRNNWLFALLTNGDGWHNNHHADPRAAAHGFHRWWEFDVTYMSICLFRKLGIVTDIVPIRRDLESDGFVHG
jgi:stearoyl-CoA desaturase (delta-9 desaturase)